MPWKVGQAQTCFTYDGKRSLKKPLNKLLSWLRGNRRIFLPFLQGPRLSDSVLLLEHWIVVLLSCVLHIIVIKYFLHHFWKCASMTAKVTVQLIFDWRNLCPQLGQYFDCPHLCRAPRLPLTGWSTSTAATVKSTSTAIDWVGRLDCQRQNTSTAADQFRKEEDCWTSRTRAARQSYAFCGKTKTHRPWSTEVLWAPRRLQLRTWLDWVLRVEFVIHKTKGLKTNFHHRLRLCLVVKLFDDYRLVGPAICQAGAQQKSTIVWVWSLRIGTTQPHPTLGPISTESQFNFIQITLPLAATGRIRPRNSTDLE